MRTAWFTFERPNAMPSPDTVERYLAALDPERRSEFERLRRWVRRTLPDAKETMGYRMPTYEGRERICAIAAQKRHFALYVCESEALERHRRPAAAALESAAAPGMVHQDPPHRHARDRHEVLPGLPRLVPLLHQAHVRLVHERRGLQRVIGALAAEETRRQGPQLLVDQREQVGHGLVVAAAGLRQKPRDLPG